jgi:hypothetical protein
VKVDESADSHSWGDNFVCTDTNIGLEWSMAGPLPGRRCVRVHESADEVAAAWADNFLCLPESSPYELTWSTAGKIAGQSCVRWFEAADVGGSWGDNYLCVRDTGQGAMGGVGAGPTAVPGAGAAAASGAAAGGAGEGVGAGEGGCAVSASHPRGSGAALPVLAAACALLSVWRRRKRGERSTARAVTPSRR